MLSTPNAQELLKLLSILPDGLSEVALEEIGTSLDQLQRCKSTLCRTALAHVDQDGRLRVLVPIREYVRTALGPPSGSIGPLRSYLYQLVDLYSTFHDWPAVSVIQRISAELGNIRSVITHTLQENGSQMEDTVLCIVGLAKYARAAKIQVTGDLLRSISSLVEELKDDGLRGQYYLELLYLHDAVDPGEAISKKAIDAFGKMKDPSRQGVWPSLFPSSFSPILWLAADAYTEMSGYYLLNGDTENANEFCTRGLSLAEQTRDLSRQALGRIQLAQLMDYQGRFGPALAEAHKARCLAQAAGGIYMESRCTQLLAFCSLSIGDFPRAAAFCTEAMALHGALGLDESSPLLRDIKNTRAEIFLRKTEYSDARRLNKNLVDSYSTLGRTANNNLAFAHCNLAIIDIASGNHESADVLENLRMARQSFARTTRPLGLVVCDLTLADLEFVRGDYENAEKLVSHDELVVRPGAKDCISVNGHCVEIDKRKPSLGASKE